MAKEAHVKVSLDTNIRPRLWDVEEARKILLPLVKQTDILLTDPQDSEILIGVSDPEKASKTFLKMGPSITVLKMGRKGSLATTIDKTIRQDTFEALVEDVTGAGDAFAACFISSLLKGWSLKKALEVANVAGSLVVTVRGDVENIPTMQDIDKFLESLKKG